MFGDMYLKLCIVSCYLGKQYSVAVLQYWWAAICRDRYSMPYKVIQKKHGLLWLVKWHSIVDVKLPVQSPEQKVCQLRMCRRTFNMLLSLYLNWQALFTHAWPGSKNNPSFIFILSIMPSHIRPLATAECRCTVCNSKLSTHYRTAWCQWLSLV